MKNLMKKVATSLGLTLMVASLLVISANQAQAKVKKQRGNSAKVKSQAKRGYHLEDISLGVQGPRQRAVSNGSARFSQAETLSSNVQRKKVAGAEGFSIDIGTSENIKSKAERALATQAGNDTVTVNDRIGIAPKRVRGTTKHTRQ